MNDKKNIERLFQERFKDFDAIPPENAWENIALKLEKKEAKKRVIPFWFKATGIAAGFVIGYFVLNNVNQNSSDFKVTDEKVVLENSNKSKERSTDFENSTTNVNPKNNSENPLDKQKVATINNETTEKQKVANQNNTIPIQKNKSESLGESIANSSENSVNNKQDKSIQNASNEQRVAIINKKSTNKQNLANQKNTERIQNIKTENLQESIANSNVNSVNKNNQLFNNSVVKNDTKLEVNEIVTENNSKTVSKNTSVIRKNTNFNSQNSNLESNVFNKEKNIVAEKNNLLENSKLYDNKENNTVLNKSSTNSINKYNNQNTNDFSNKENNKERLSNPKNESIFYSNEIIQNNTIASKIEKQNNNNFNDTTEKNKILNQSKIITKPNDSIIKLQLAENELQKILLEKESKEIEKVISKKSSQWKIKPNVAPIFMNATAGSPIDMRFADNSKTYDNNLSIGVGVDYEISKKFTFRTGINQFDLSYNTNDVAFYANINAFGGSTNELSKGMTTVNLAQTASLMTIIDNKVASGAVDKEIGQNKKTGALNQRIGYLEFPVEISYKLVDKKFGVQMFTGFSTLILNENSLSLVSNDSKTNVGEANNLNPIHFSTNLGVAFKYSFWKSFEMNFEPTFKYQLYTFNTNAGGFKPYFIGLYSGVSYKF